MKKVLAFCLAMFAMFLLADCQKNTPLPDYYLLASEVKAVTLQPNGEAGELVWVNLDLSKKAAERVNAYQWPKDISEGRPTITLVNGEQQMEIPVLGPFSSQFYGPCTLFIGVPESDCSILSWASFQQELLTLLGQQEAE